MWRSLRSRHSHYIWLSLKWNRENSSGTSTSDLLELSFGTGLRERLLENLTLLCLPNDAKVTISGTYRNRRDLILTSWPFFSSKFELHSLACSEPLYQCVWGWWVVEEQKPQKTSRRGSGPVPLEHSEQGSLRSMCLAVSAHRQQTVPWHVLLVEPWKSPKWF